MTTVPPDANSINSVFYALSTMAQTCAALAALVGALALYRLQAMREAHDLVGRTIQDILTPDFGRHNPGRRIQGLGQVDVDAYIVKRQEQKAVGSTIRRELGTLRRMLRLAYENGKLMRLPILHLPKEGAPREGFFEREPYEAVRRRLSPDLQVAAAIAYTFGWRTQSEVLTLERRQLDLEAGTLRLDPGTTKNDEGRVVYLTPELKSLLAAQLARVETLQRRTGKIVPFLFPYLTGKKRAGERRQDFRKAWASACKEAGVPGMHRHDFRRPAVRNMVNAGVSERVAMKVTGHKTRAVFDRYHIVSPADLQDVARKLTGTFPGTSEGATMPEHSTTR